MTNNKETKEDFLSVDKPIPGQNFVCLSFVSPESCLKNKEVFKIQHFLKSFVTKLNVSHELNLEYENVCNEYNNFILSNKDKLEKDFSEENNFQTNIRGLKVRGVYDTKKEAEVRCQVLQKIDSSHNVYLAPVGYWLPWDPDPNSIQDQVYLEDELNNLVKEYKNNETQMDEYYNLQTRERAQKVKDQVDSVMGNNGIFNDNVIPTLSEQDSNIDHISEELESHP